MPLEVIYFPNGFLDLDNGKQALWAVKVIQSLVSYTVHEDK